MTGPSPTELARQKLVGGVQAQYVEERPDLTPHLLAMPHQCFSVDDVTIAAADPLACDVASIRSVTIRCAARSVIPTMTAMSRRRTSGSRAMVSDSVNDPYPDRPA